MWEGSPGEGPPRSCFRIHKLVRQGVLFISLASLLTVFSKCQQRLGHWNPGQEQGHMYRILCTPRQDSQDSTAAHKHTMKRNWQLHVMKISKIHNKMCQQPRKCYSSRKSYGRGAGGWCSGSVWQDLWQWLRHNSVLVHLNATHLWAAHGRSEGSNRHASYSTIWPKPLPLWA